MDTLSKFVLPGLVLLFTLASGLWLSQAGKPLNSAIFNIHKLVALGAVILTAIQIVNAVKSTGFAGLIAAIVVLLAACILALFATGAMMSIGKTDYALMLTVHRVALFLVVLAFAALLYVLNGKIS